MINFLKKIKIRLNSIIWTLASTGIMLMLLAILTVFGGDILSRLALGVFVVAIGYVFLFLAHKFWGIKKELEKFFKI